MHDLLILNMAVPVLDREEPSAYTTHIHIRSYCRLLFFLPRRKKKDRITDTSRKTDRARGSEMCFLTTHRRRRHDLVSEADPPKCSVRFRRLALKASGLKLQAPCPCASPLRRRLNLGRVSRRYSACFRRRSTSCILPRPLQTRRSAEGP